LDCIHWESIDVMTHQRPQGIHWWFLILLLSTAYADAGCDEQLVDTVRSAHALVSTLSADTRPGGPRTDDMRWMREQLQLIDAACSRGGDVEAAWRVEAVLERLKRVPARSHLTGGLQEAPAMGDAAGSVAMVRRGSRTVKADPSASRLTTSMVPS
jgi:hypothetical protein